MDFWNSLATFLSIIAAIVSFFQAKSAKKYAKTANEQIFKQQQIIELTDLLELRNNVFSELSLYGPAADLVSIRGSNSSIVAMKVSNYLSEIMKCNLRLKSITDLESRCQDLKILITDFSNSRGAKGMQISGIILYDELEKLCNEIQNILIEAKERIVLE